MLISFTVPTTGTNYSVDLKPELVAEYKVAVQDLGKYHTPSCDKARRLAHNKVSQSVFYILRKELPAEEDSELWNEARSIVTRFLEPSLIGRSTVRDLRCSGMLL